MAKLNQRFLGCTSAAIVWLALAAALSSLAQDAGKRQLVNDREVLHEIRAVPGAEEFVQNYLLPFREYHELILYNPAFGYYSRGRVNFVDDFQTFPNLLAPYFGQMVAQQIFRMWEGMRRSGTLSPKERFTIAEIGAGNGKLAESILDYLDQRQREDPKWREFSSQVVYFGIDRAPALREVQRQRNARFESRFEAGDGDATNLTAAIPTNSLKGIILSNELLDVFGVHKVILSHDGSAEVAFVAPFLPVKAWNEIRRQIGPAVERLISTDDRMVKDKVLGGDRSSEIYLSRDSFVSLLKSLSGAKNYASVVQSIQFHEIYLPVAVIPALKEHLRRYAHAYAIELAARGKGIVTYINLGEEQFMREAGLALKAGYVITIDYGSNWEGILKPGQPHLRTYGPGTRESDPSGLLTGLAMGRMESGRAGSGSQPSSGWETLADIGSATHGSTRGNPDPYHSPTLNDVTTDVNFSYLAAEGMRADLHPVYFGPQRALRTGTTVSLSAKNREPQSPGREAQLTSWMAEFVKDSTFKVLVQQKLRTDDSYVYPESHPESLDIEESRFSAAQRRLAAQIEQRLTQ